MRGVERGRNSRVLRGGSWGNNPENCRAAYRNRNAPDTRNNNYGLRVCFRLHGRWPSLDQCPEREGSRPLAARHLAVLAPILTPACFGDKP